jgi:hypothetical protein
MQDHINLKSLKIEIENLLFNLGKEIKIHKVDGNIILDIDYHVTANKIINAIENNFYTNQEDI